MSSIFEEIWNEGRMEGEIKGKAEMARELAKLGMPVNTIAQMAKVDLATVKDWLAQKPSMAE